MEEIKDATVYYVIKEKGPYEEVEEMQYVKIKSTPEEWYSIQDTHTDKDGILVVKMDNAPKLSAKHMHADFTFIPTTPPDKAKPHLIMSVAAKNEIERLVKADENLIIRNLALHLKIEMQLEDQKAFGEKLENPSEELKAAATKAGFDLKENSGGPMLLPTLTFTSKKSDPKTEIKIDNFGDIHIVSPDAPKNSTPEKITAFFQKQRDEVLKLCAIFEENPSLRFTVTASLFSRGIDEDLTAQFVPNQKKPKVKEFVDQLQAELNKPVPIAPLAPVTNGIAAGSTLVVPPAAANTYSIHKLIDRCRPEINAKVNPKGYSLPDGKYELVMKDGHKINIEANGNMAADLAPLSSKNETEFAKTICDDLKAIVEMYMAMHTKLKDAAFPENKINLFVIKKGITSDADKIKMAQIEKLVAKEMNAYLSQPEYAVIKDKFTVLGQAVTKAPAPAPAKKGPEPSAPPLSEEDAKGADAPKADSAAPGALKMGPAPQSPPASPRPK